MIKIGMMIGDRYEILEKIGTGGMSDVYKAKCHKLNRYVAVKILKQEFSENANFVSKFRIEAQAAAGLMHPNIVNVYDVGEENGIYYIVMELVEGITLKKYIEKKARLSYKEAVSIAIQVCMGIEAAHNNHIIHRDIKPQNIIISKDGKVKVTDFGIAKAATSNTITSNVMGSVHYTSPEQARGGYSDEKSDIYSLGITLFEMLTGRVPFNGETTVAIAIKHIQEEMPSPKEYVPEVPNSVEGIVLKCCRKYPDRRYPNMRELISDLKRSLMNPDEDFVISSGPDVDGSTKMISDRDMARIKQQAGTRLSHDGTTGRIRYAEREESDYEEEEDIAEEGDEYDYNPKMEGVITVLAVIAGVIICGIIIFLLLRVFDVFGTGTGEKLTSPIITTEESEEENTVNSESNKESVEEVEMPLVTGWNIKDAQRVLEKRSLIVETEYVESDEYAEDIVIETSHEAGTKVAKGTTIKLTVSSGAAGVILKETAGKTREDAETTLTNQGFQISWVENFSESVPAGVVISQDPASGTKVPEGSVITVNVSKGSQSDTIMVPNVIGMSEMDGTVELVEAGLTITTVSYVNHSQIPEGQICYQSYSQGSYVAPGTGVEIRVSMGTGTYKYNGNIEAPSAAEAPDYAAGSEVKIVITTDSGQELYNTTVTSFTQSVNFYGVSSQGATVTLYYTVNTDQGAAQKSFSRRLEFVKE